MKTMNESFCSTCGEFVCSSIQNTTETFHARGIDITITSPARICENCGEIIFDEVLDDEKLKLVYRAYREQKGLLQLEEIRTIRERRNLTQEECSKILGFNVARYENGSLQSEEEDKRLVRISQAVFFFEQMTPERSRSSSVVRRVRNEIRRKRSAGKFCC